jgi:ankyrin repeat protein
MASTKLQRSHRLRDSIVDQSKAQRQITALHAANSEDIMFMHILDCIGALSCIRAMQKKENHCSDSDNNEEGRQASALLPSKHRVFWQAVCKIADREAALEDISTTREEENEKASALDFMLECFPDDSKRSDGRLWLPLHLAVSVSSSRLEDIHTLFTANPAAIKAPADAMYKLNPCHFAVMMKNPRMEMIQRLQIYYPDFGSSLDSELNTPLHLAARYSESAAMVRELAQLHPAALEMKNGDEDTPLHLAARYSDSVAMVRELAQLHPAALEMKNGSGETPLHLAARYSDCAAMLRELAQLHTAALEMKNKTGDTPLHLAVKYSSSCEVFGELVALSPATLVAINRRGETPLAATIAYYSEINSEFDQKLRVLLKAAPQAARIACPSFDNNLPLHIILYRSDPPATREQVVLAAYREAVNIPNMHGELPIHYAVIHAPLDVMKMIAEENMRNVSVIVPGLGSVAHMAAKRYRLEILRYLHSVMPELLLSVNRWDRTPLHYLIVWNNDKLSSPLSAASDGCVAVSAPSLSRSGRCSGH